MERIGCQENVSFVLGGPAQSLFKTNVLLMFIIVIISSSIHEVLAVGISSTLLYANFFSTTLLIPTFLAFPFTSLTDVARIKILPDLLIFHQIQIITNILRSKLQESEHSLKGRQLKNIWKRRK